MYGTFLYLKVIHAKSRLGFSEVKNIEVCWPSISPSFVENIDVFFRTHSTQRQKHYLFLIKEPLHAYNNCKIHITFFTVLSK